MGCYGTLNVDVALAPSSAVVQPLQVIPQTSTFTVTVTNTGYAANDYSITLGGNWAGITDLSQSNPTFSLLPNQSASSTVSVTLAANQPGSVVIPITTTVTYATSSGPASRTLTFQINIPEQPTISAQPTTTSIVSGNGAIVSPGSSAHLAATVRDQNNALVTQGTLTFYGGGAAIATVAADAQGVFAYDWLVPSNAPQGFQAFSATFGGFATNDFSINLAPSSANGTFTVGNGQGVSCQFDVDCLSGHCVDGVCCQVDCDGTCGSCDLPESPGVCGYTPLGDGDDGCQGPQRTCDGAGACKQDNLQACTSGDDCASGVCIPLMAGMMVCDGP